MFSKFTVIMRFNPLLHLWFMSRAKNGKFIMHFPNCGNITRAFPNMEKGKDNYYDITIRKYEPTKTEVENAAKE